MATWKKVIVSGSSAELNNVFASGNITGSNMSSSGDLFAKLDEQNLSDLVVYDTTTGKFHRTASSAIIDYTLQDPPSDGTFDDGLLDFDDDTTYTDAIDDINEVLAGLAPSAAPTLRSLGDDETAGVVSKISFGSSNNVSTYTDVTSTTLSDGEESTLDINGQFNAETSLTEGSAISDIRMGTFAAIQEISGDLNITVGADGSPFINYSGSSFGNGDTGTLKLFVNNDSTAKVSIDLSAASAASGTSSLGSNNELLQVGPTQSAHFPATGNELTVFKHRSGSFSIPTGAQRNGWNFARVIHSVGGTDYKTNYLEWVNDPVGASAAMGSTAENITFTGTGSFYMSGIEYHTGGQATYKVNVTNAYRNVYNTGNQSFTTIYDEDAVWDIKEYWLQGDGLNNVTNTMAGNTISTTFPTLDGSADCHLTDLNITASLSASAGASVNYSLIGDSDDVNLGVRISSIASPIKSNLTNESAKTLTGLLIDNRSRTTQTLQKETFVSESYRLPSDASTVSSYDTHSAIENSTWDSTTSLVASPNNSLLAMPPYTAGGLSNTGNGQLVYPDSSTRTPDSGDFRNNSDGNTNGPINGPDGNPNYSAISGDRYYYRKFKNESGGSVATAVIKIKGESTTLGTAGNESGGTISVRVKYGSIGAPGTPGLGTGWLDLGAGQADGADLSVDNTPSNASGTPDTTIDATGATNTLKFASSHVDYSGNTVTDDGYIVLWITTADDYNGKITEIEITNF